MSKDMLNTGKFCKGMKKSRISPVYFGGFDKSLTDISTPCGEAAQEVEAFQQIDVTADGLGIDAE